MKQEPGRQPPGIPVLQGGENVNAGLQPSKKGLRFASRPDYAALTGYGQFGNCKPGKIVARSQRLAEMAFFLCPDFNGGTRRDSVRGADSTISALQTRRVSPPSMQVMAAIKQTL